MTTSLCEHPVSPIIARGGKGCSDDQQAQVRGRAVKTELPHGVAKFVGKTLKNDESFVRVCLGQKNQRMAYVPSILRMRRFGPRVLS